MTANRILRYVVVLLVTLGGVTLLRADDAADGGKAKIEALIKHVESLDDASFVRNGSAYSAKNAAKFLRGKWDAKRKEIRSPAEFIEKVATKSSTTGKPYLIRFKDGSEVSCGAYLTGRLKKLESSTPGT
jgi:hypothetical protein